MKVCSICGNPLTGNQTMTCSKECYRKRQKELNRAYYHKNKGHAKDRACEICGKPVGYRRQFTCSAGCSEIREKQLRKVEPEYRETTPTTTYLVHKYYREGTPVEIIGKTLNIPKAQ